MRAPYKKTLRILAYAFGGTIFTVILVAAAALVWLRTASGERFVANLAATALAEQGITLRTQRFEGPLPSRLRLSGISLADAKGEWFRAKELEVRPDLFALLGGTAAVFLLRADEPELYRLPELPSPQTAEEKPSAPERPGIFNLPIGVRLDVFSLENIGIYTPVLFPGAEIEPGLPLLTATLSGTAAAKAKSPLKATVTLEAAVADTAELARRLGDLPLEALSLHASLEAEIGEGLEAKLAGTLIPGTGGETYPLDFGAGANLLGDALVLPEVFLRGQGLRLGASVNIGLADDRATAKATLAAENNGGWEKLLAALTGTSVGGALSLRADASQRADGSFTAGADIQGSAIHWGTEKLQEILGSSLALKAEARGGKKTYDLRLETFNAGIFTASGEASFNAAANTAQAAFTANVSNLAPLLPGAVGSLTAKADVSGTFDAPEFSLTAASDSVTHSGGAFGGIAASARGNAVLKEEKTLRGTVAASLAKSPAGPVTFKTELDARREKDGAFSARLADLTLKLAGTHVTADIEASAPGGEQAAPPALKGRAKARILDWKPLAALTGLPLSGGKAEFDALFSHEGAEQKITAGISAERVAFAGDFFVTALKGTFDAGNWAKPNARLELSTGRSAVGSFGWESGSLFLVVREGAGKAAAVLRTDASAQTAVKNLTPASADARPDRRERMSALASFSLKPETLTLERFAVRLPDSSMGAYLTAPAALSLGGTVGVRDFNLNIFPGGGTLACDARFNSSDADAALTLKDFPFRLIREAFDAPLPDGSAEARLNLKKRGASVSGSVDAAALVQPAPAAGAAAGSLSPVAFSLKGTLDKNHDANFPELKTSAKMVRLKGRATIAIPDENGERPPEAVILFNVPLRFNAEGLPEPAVNAPLAATLAWLGDIAPVWAVAPFPDRSLSGAVQVKADIKGTLAKPVYIAKAYMAGGRFEDAVLGLLLTDIALEAESATGKESVIRLRAEDAQKGFVALEGSLEPDENGLRIAARGHINHLEPLHRDDLSLRLSGRLAVDGPVTAPMIKADMEVERGELSLLTTLGGGVRTLEISEPGSAVPAPSGPDCDITVTVPNRFYIRGRGLDSEWAGDLAIRGPLSGPSLTGSLRPLRGTLDLLSRPFAFEKGDISFFGGDRINPALNLSLAYQGANVTAVIRAAGTANKPKITLESQPSLPQDQILADVLFGKELSRLSRFEALQVANSVRELANIGGSGGMDVLSGMRTTLGIDMLRVGSSNSGNSASRSVSGAPGAGAMGGTARSGGNENSSTPTVEAGKYINDAIYVGVEQGATADSTGVRVEVELLPNLTLQGKSTPRSSEVGLGWKRDY